MPNINDYAIKRFLARELARLPDCGNGRMLDLGCGTMPYRPIYRRYFVHCFAGDYEQRTAALDVRLDAPHLPFADNCFDLVLFSEVIEHVSDAEAAIAEIVRILRPGGVLLITWPLNYMIHESPHDYTRFTEYGMTRLMQLHGLRVETIVYRGGAVALTVILAEFFARNVLEAIVRIPLLGGAFRPIRAAACWLAFDLPISIYFVVRSILGIRNHFRPGEGLTGWRGSLRRWTLGYCARARKVGAR